ncbi:hypothetical protein [Spiroplasma sp. SV19]|uniref:hypothetical protein n=1 Tax=Spiroplasma sp. SV19 TaxID=2570468 RepID=UPI0024B6D272|nr:hypothetical protein [Spiroplasma sp. SV19]WHQ36842.1 hypothetical protein E7Y35_02925 [Spiroplasma sp. SV19]
MKKLLSILGVVGLSSTSISAIACTAPNIDWPKDPIKKINLTEVANKIKTIDGTTLFLNDSINDEALELIYTFLPEKVNISYEQTPIYVVGTSNINVKIWQTDLTSNFLANVTIKINNIQPKPTQVDLDSIAANLTSINGKSLFSGQKNDEISNLLKNIINDIKVKFEFKNPNDVLNVGDNLVNITLIDRNYLTNTKEVAVTVKNVQLAPVKVDLNSIITNRNLGEIYIGTALEPDGTKISNVLKTNNTNLMINKVKVINVKVNNFVGSAVITPIDNIFYFNDVTVNFTITNIEAMPTEFVPMHSFINAGDGAIYLISNDYKVYKLLADGSNFEAVFKNNYKVFDLKITSNGTIYIGTESGLYKSSDNGNNFINVGASSNLEVNDIYLSNNNKRIYIKDKEEKLYQYDDEKNTLTTVPETGFTMFGEISQVLVTNDGTVYFVNKSRYDKTKIGLSKWNKTMSNLQKITELEGIIINKLQEDQRGIIFVTTNSGLYKSSDNGNNFLIVSEIKGLVDAIFINSAGDVYVAGNIVYKCAFNEGTFKNVTSTPSHGEIEVLKVDQNNNIYYITVYGSVHKNNNINLATSGLSPMDFTIDKAGNLYFASMSACWKSVNF